MQKLVKTVTDRAAKTSLIDWSKEFQEMQRELKAYTLENLKEDDFMFTDQMTQDHERGIKGPKEVKERIKSYLAEMQIYSKEELAGLF